LQNNALHSFLRELPTWPSRYGLRDKRGHNSHLVNLAYINAYHKGKGGGYVVLEDGREIEVSVRRKDVLLKKLHSL